MERKIRLIAGWSLIVAGIIGIERNFGILPRPPFLKPALSYVLFCCGGVYLLWKVRTEE